MASIFRQVELSDEELKIIVETLKYALNVCPIETVTYEVSVTTDKVQNLIEKLETALNAKQ